MKTGSMVSYVSGERGTEVIEQTTERKGQPLVYRRTYHPRAYCYRNRRAYWQRALLWRGNSLVNPFASVYWKAAV